MGKEEFAGRSGFYLPSIASRSRMTSTVWRKSCVVKPTGRSAGVAIGPASANAQVRLKSGTLPHLMIAKLRILSPSLCTMQLFCARSSKGSVFPCRAAHPYGTNLVLYLNKEMNSTSLAEPSGCSGTPVCSLSLCLAQNQADIAIGPWHSCVKAQKSDLDSNCTARTAQLQSLQNQHDHYLMQYLRRMCFWRGPLVHQRIARMQWNRNAGSQTL